MSDTLFVVPFAQQLAANITGPLGSTKLSAKPNLDDVEITEHDSGWNFTGFIVDDLLVRADNVDVVAGAIGDLENYGDYLYLRAQSAEGIFTQGYHGYMNFGSIYDDSSMKGYGETIVASYLFDDMSLGGNQNTFRVTGWSYESIEVNVGYGNTVYSGNNDDVIEVADEAQNTTVFGGDGNDSIYAGDGNDVLGGGDGNDELDGGDGDNQLFGDDGDDEISSGNGDDFVEGGEGRDHIDSGAGDDFVEGGQGRDVIHGDDGDDTLFGGEGDDHLGGGDGNDRIDAGDGSDYVHGDDGNDVIRGGDGDDEIFGGDGNDVLGGGDGNDSIYAGDGADTVMASEGFDFIDLGGSDNSVDVVYLGVSGDEDMITGVEFGSDKLIGPDGTDMTEEAWVNNGVLNGHGGVVATVEFVDDSFIF